VKGVAGVPEPNRLTGCGKLFSKGTPREGVKITPLWPVGWMATGK